MKQVKQPYPMGAIIPIIRSGLETAGFKNVRIGLYKDEDFEYLMIEDEFQINYGEWIEERTDLLNGGTFEQSREGWELWLWTQTHGSLYEPPDCYETLVWKGTLTNCILEIAKHYHNIQLENACYDCLYQEDNLERKHE